MSFQSLWSLYWCLMCRRDVPVLHIESMLPTFSHHSPLCSCSKEVETWVGHSSVVLNLHVSHSRYCTGSCISCSSPSTLYTVAEYLMLVDGEFLNALLPADSIPSNSNHLFWDRSLESFECLETYSHLHKCPINVPWSMDSFKFSTLTHLFTPVRFHSSILIPIFIIDGWSRVC